MTFDDIDFAALHREQMERLCRAGRGPKPAEAWDERAAGYGGSAGSDDYVDEFIGRMNLHGARTLLDVGCGPGTLALPLARRLEQVVALDYSGGMLQVLRDRASREGLTNICTVQRAWEDDWSDVPVCDIAIASRSTGVRDLPAALRKLHAHARLRVYLTYPAKTRFIDREILQLVGAETTPMPSCMLVLGILQQMGVYPRLDYIEPPAGARQYADFQDFKRRVVWSAGACDEDALQRLRQWYDVDPDRARARIAPMRWAFISWDKE